MIRGMMFDMDGVLFDSEAVGEKIFGELLTERGYDPGDSFRCLLGANHDWDRVFCRERYGEGFPFDEVIMTLHDRRQRLAVEGKIPLKKGAAESVAYCRAQGFPMGLVSGTNRDLIDTYLETVPALRGAFDVIISGDLIRAAKPDPEPYLLAARALEVSPADCVGVEDSYNGVRSLHAAGMRTVMVPDLIRYDERFVPYVDDLLPDLSALPNLLERLRRGGRLR